MNQQDLNALTDAWQSDTNWLNEKIDKHFKSAQDHAYALGLKRGMNIVDLSDEELLTLAEPFGAFQHADAQGHKRLEFARAVLTAARNKKEQP